MALFKISKGLTKNLPSTYNEGYCYFTPEDGKFYIDISDANSASSRVVLNAHIADVANSVAWGNVTSKPSTFTPSAHNQASNTINALTGYNKTSVSAGALAATDTLNAALAKLERLIDTKQASGTYKTQQTAIESNTLLNNNEWIKKIYQNANGELSFEYGSFDASALIPKNVGTTKGDMLYWAAGSAPQRLAIGSNGTVLQVVNGVPTWDALVALPAGGSAGQYLVKNSATDGDAKWATLTIPTLSGGSAAAANATIVGGVTVSGHAISVAKKTITAGSGMSVSGTTSTITIGHSNSVTAKTAYVDSATTASANGGSIKVTDVKYDAQGHITGTQDRTIKLSQITYSLSGLGGISAVNFAGTELTKSGTVVSISKADAISALGITNAMHFVGTTSTALSDGSTIRMIALGTSTVADYEAQNGDVVITSDGEKEYVWCDGRAVGGGGEWELLGGDSSYKVKQTPVSSPSLSQGSSIQFISDVSQDADGVITLTKKTIDTSGEWSGNAATATKLATSRTIDLTGAVIGSGSFDGSGDLSIETTVNHTHNYAGSTSAGGSANSAVKLDSSAGSATLPVYFSDGKPVAINTTGVGISITGSSASCTGNAATATKFASAQSIALTGDVTGSVSSQAGWSVATTLAASGVTAGSYGPSANASPAHSGTFSVPYFTVDAKGRVTAASTKTITLPAIYSLPIATNTALGGIKPWYSHTAASTGPTTGSNATAVAVNAISTTSGRYYAVEMDSVGRAFVNVPWVDTNTNTTYSAGTGISLSGTTFSNSGVRSIATGSANGTISVNTNGTSADVAVKGLGSAAYTASTAYAAASHSHSYLPLSGGTLTGALTLSYTTTATMDSTTTNPQIVFAEDGSQPVALVYTDYDSYRGPAGLKVIGKSTDASPAWFEVEGEIYASKVHNAIWNDYAEFRKTSDEKEPGRCVIEVGDGSLEKSYARLQPGANIISDTYGYCMGETEDCKTPLAVSGRVLAYPYENKYDFLPGEAVCSGPDGTVSRMTREEIMMYPDRIVGTVSEIPTYEEWGSGHVKVNGRIWIKVK